MRTENMEHDYIQSLIAKYLSGNTSAQEQEELFHWIDQSEDNQTFFENSIDAWNMGMKASAPLTTNPEKAWATIEGEIKPTVKIRRMTFFRIAAAIALVMAAGIWWMQNSTDNQVAEMISLVNSELIAKEIALPDGSTVVLNKGSEIRFSKKFEDRSIRLNGEAFFDVATDSLRPFRVITGDTETQVLGTSFNIRAYPEDEDVLLVVETGKVAFKAVTEEGPKVEAVIVEAGYQAVAVKGSDSIPHKKAIEDKNLLSWKTSSLNFENVSLKSVTKALERHFEIEISIKNPQLENCVFYGVYDNPDLNAVFEMLKYAMNLDINEVEKGKWTIDGKACR